MQKSEKRMTFAVRLLAFLVMIGIFVFAFAINWNR